MNTYLLVDGTNLLHRAHYALKTHSQGIQIAPSGVFVGATQSVLQSLLSAIRTYHVTHLAVCFDNGLPTFRHALYDGYKASRDGKEKDPALTSELELLANLCRSAGFGIVAPDGYEADDAIATLATLATQAAEVDSQATILVYSGDRDLFALAGHQTSILYPGSGPAAKLRLTSADVREKMGVYPHQIADYKSLCGDTSDCIPGVLGIGAKTATSLLSRYESIEEIYQPENFNMVTGLAFRKLHPPAAREMAQLSKKLATLHTSIPLNQPLEDCKLDRLDFAQLASSLQALGLTKIAQNYQRLTS